MQDLDLSTYQSQVILPSADSRKGDNGRVLVIGGSTLFHAAAFWSASMAAHIVDMVHFSSPVMENNDLIRVRAKSKFWDGIVVPYEEIDHYIEEDDCTLIGPGMERGETTKQIVNNFLNKYPHKKWVIDGGALQEVDPTLLSANMIITPNQKELAIIKNKLGSNYSNLQPTVLAKGPTDTISSRTNNLTITGGDPGLTKGGTGDVLSGLVAGIAAKSDNFAACVLASYAVKSASESLSARVGPFFSPTNLIDEIPLALKTILKV